MIETRENILTTNIIPLIPNILPLATKKLIRPIRGLFSRESGEVENCL